MQQSIIYKTLCILGCVIIAIFLSAGYLFYQNDKQLIDEIRAYNLTQAMKALDQQQEIQLQNNQQLMEDTVTMIAKNSSLFLLNFDKEGLKKSLHFDMKKEGVIAIKVFDTLSNEIFLMAIQNNQKISFINKEPQTLQAYKTFQHPIEHLNYGTIEKLGTITLFYDESIIKNKIQKLKENTTQDINQFNTEIDSKMLNTNIIKLILSIATLITILILISILLMKFVNTPLKKLQQGLDNFFLFLQNKKDHAQIIELHSEDEFGQMAQNLNDNISVSARLHEEIHELNTHLEQRVEDKTKKITTLLNNAGQGFLTFTQDFVVDDEYSKECEKLISNTIAHQDITQLLFKDPQKIELFKTTLLNAFDEKVLIKRNSYLSLLPKIILLNKKAVKLEYKILDDRFMLILTNITAQKKLEKKIKKEQEILKMIVSIVSESDVFYETKKEYLHFIENFKNLIIENKTPLHNISHIYRTIHTFKGTFSQLFMQEVVQFLHGVESAISQLQKETTHSNQDLICLLEEYDFQSNFDKSLSVIEEILGEEYLESDNYLKVDLSDITLLKEKIESILNNYEETSEECQDILAQIQNLASVKLYTQLHPFITSTEQIAKKLDKEIYPIQVICDKDIVITESYKPFIKSLVHVFRNCIDHGIENADERLEQNKDEQGTISCNVERLNNTLHITIADDGEGIDVDKLKQKLSSKGIDTANLTTQEIYHCIFKENISTKSEVSELSGRGVGMGAVAHELEQLKGEVNITSQLHVGTTFEFVIPLDETIKK